MLVSKHNYISSVKVCLVCVVCVHGVCVCECSCVCVCVVCVVACQYAWCVVFACAWCVRVECVSCGVCHVDCAQDIHFIT